MDSVLPMAAMIARFTAGLSEVTELAGGTPSRDSLVAAFVMAVERADSSTLSRLAVSRAEYGHLYFPTSRHAAPPYELPPDIAWMLSSAASEKGISRVLHRLAGRPLEYRGYRCGDASSEGDNRFWRECVIDYGHPREGRVNRRLFGTIIERGGSYKILTYANDF